LIKPVEAIVALALNREEREALSDFLEKVKQQEGNNLLEVVLFGSYARNEQSPESDIDVAILLLECKGLEHERSFWQMA
jgi:predicted nucleotidyltransferase